MNKISVTGIKNDFSEIGEKIAAIVNEIVDINRYITNKSNDTYLYLQIPIKDQQCILNLLKEKRLNVKCEDDCIRILMTNFSKKIIQKMNEHIELKCDIQYCDI